jgi:hypothetical protein
MRKMILEQNEVFEKKYEQVEEENGWCGLSPTISITPDEIVMKPSPVIDEYITGVVDGVNLIGDPGSKKALFMDLYNTLGSDVWTPELEARLEWELLEIIIKMEDNTIIITDPNGSFVEDFNPRQPYFETIAINGELYDLADAYERGLAQELIYNMKGYTNTNGFMQFDGSEVLIETGYRIYDKGSISNQLRGRNEIGDFDNQYKKDTYKISNDITVENGTLVKVCDVKTNTMIDGVIDNVLTDTISYGVTTDPNRKPYYTYCKPLELTEQRIIDEDINCDYPTDIQVGNQVGGILPDITGNFTIELVFKTNTIIKDETLLTNFVIEEIETFDEELQQNVVTSTNYYGIDVSYDSLGELVIKLGDETVVIAENLLSDSDYRLVIERENTTLRIFINEEYANSTITSNSLASTKSTQINYNSDDINLSFTGELYYARLTTDLISKSDNIYSIYSDNDVFSIGTLISPLYLRTDTLSNTGINPSTSGKDVIWTEILLDELSTSDGIFFGVAEGAGVAPKFMFGTGSAFGLDDDLGFKEFPSNTIVGLNVTGGVTDDLYSIIIRHNIIDSKVAIFIGDDSYEVNLNVSPNANYFIGGEGFDESNYTGNVYYTRLSDTELEHNLKVDAINILFEKGENEKCVDYMGNKIPIYDPMSDSAISVSTENLLPDGGSMSFYSMLCEPRYIGEAINDTYFAMMASTGQTEITEIIDAGVDREFIIKSIKTTFNYNHPDYTTTPFEFFASDDGIEWKSAYISADELAEDRIHEINLKSRFIKIVVSKGIDSQSRMFIIYNEVGAKTLSDSIVAYYSTPDADLDSNDSFKLLSNFEPNYKVVSKGITEIKAQNHDENSYYGLTLHDIVTNAPCEYYDDDNSYVGFNYIMKGAVEDSQIDDIIDAGLGNELLIDTMETTYDSVLNAPTDQFEIHTSDDGTNWIKAYEVLTPTMGNMIHNVDAKGRFIRLIVIPSGTYDNYARLMFAFNRVEKVEIKDLVEVSYTAVEPIVTNSFQVLYSGDNIPEDKTTEDTINCWNNRIVKSYDFDIEVSYSDEDIEEIPYIPYIADWKFGVTEENGQLLCYKYENMTAFNEDPDDKFSARFINVKVTNDSANTLNLSQVKLDTRSMGVSLLIYEPYIDALTGYDTTDLTYETTAINNYAYVYRSRMGSSTKDDIASIVRTSQDIGPTDADNFGSQFASTDNKFVIQLEERAEIWGIKNAEIPSMGGYTGSVTITDIISGLVVDTIDSSETQMDTWEKLTDLGKGFYEFQGTGANSGWWSDWYFKYI